MHHLVERYHDQGNCSAWNSDAAVARQSLLQKVGSEFHCAPLSLDYAVFLKKPPLIVACMRHIATNIVANVRSNIWLLTMNVT